MNTPDLQVYGESDMPARIQASRLDGWYLEVGWPRRKNNADGWPTTPK